MSDGVKVSCGWGLVHELGQPVVYLDMEGSVPELCVPVWLRANMTVEEARDFLRGLITSINGAAQLGAKEGGA